MKDSIQLMLPIIWNIIRYFIMAGVPFLIFYILFPSVFEKNKIQTRKARDKDFIREVIHSMQTSFILGAVAIIILKTPLKGYTKIYENIHDFSLWWLPLSFVLALIMHDAYFYWMHRAVHHPALYKRIHLLHHKSVNPSPLASYSFHFFEGVLEAMIIPIILILIPLHPMTILLFAFFSFSINVYGHLGYEIAPKWLRNSILFEVLNTSIHHNIHHSKFKGNYGLYFRFWDRVMGTEHPDYVMEYDKVQVERFGV